MPSFFTHISNRFNVRLLENEAVRESIHIIDETSIINHKYKKVKGKWVYANDMTNKGDASNLTNKISKMSLRTDSEALDTLVALL